MGTQRKFEGIDCRFFEEAYRRHMSRIMTLNSTDWGRVGSAVVSTSIGLGGIVSISLAGRLDVRHRACG